MLYLGIGNAGSQLLDYVRAHAEEVKLDDLPWGATRLSVGDADTNNSVLHKFVQSKLLNIAPASDPGPPAGVRKFSLDEFWSGGCGVYHIVGEMLARQAYIKGLYTRELDSWVPRNTRNGVTVFFSAGGGTGGGAGPVIAGQLAQDWATPSRMVAVLPGVDQFARVEGETEKDRLAITCEDGFQGVSGGRFLVKYLAACADRQPGPAAYANPDLYLVSGGYLAVPPDGVSYKRAIQRLDRYITRTTLLLPDRFSVGGDVVVTALGAANWHEPGAVRQADPQLVARKLVTTALRSMDLSRDEPTGFAALPMERDRYDQQISAFLSKAPVNPPGTAAPEAVLALRQTEHVYAWLFHNPFAAPPPGKGAPQPAPNPAAVVTAVQNELNAIFPGRLPAFAVVNNPTPARVPKDTEFILLIALQSPLVDDVFRLMMYYIESSFQWRDGGIEDVAALIDTLLHDRNPLSHQDILRRLCNPTGDNSVRLAAPNEVYSPHFWGNFAYLKGKVLQALHRPKSDIEDRLLGAEEVSKALWYLREQLWLRNR